MGLHHRLMLIAGMGMAAFLSAGEAPLLADGLRGILPHLEPDLDRAGDGRCHADIQPGTHPMSRRSTTADTPSAGRVTLMHDAEEVGPPVKPARPAGRWDHFRFAMAGSATSRASMSSRCWCAHRLGRHRLSGGSHGTGEAMTAARFIIPISRSRS